MVQWTQKLTHNVNGGRVKFLLQQRMGLRSSIEEGRQVNGNLAGDYMKNTPVVWHSH